MTRGRRREVSPNPFTLNLNIVGGVLSRLEASLALCSFKAVGWVQPATASQKLVTSCETDLNVSQAGVECGSCGA